MGSKASPAPSIHPSTHQTAKTSDCVSADIPVRSPRKLVHLIAHSNFHGIKASQKSII